MRRERRCLPLLALLICINWQLGAALPVREDELDTSTRLLGSSVVTSVSVVTDDGQSGDAFQADSRKAPAKEELPQSPANLFTPDRFQFYTYNDRGDMITRQMTEQEIQSLIAAGGGHLPMDEPQKAEDMLTGGKKVADVVQKVQNVLKSAMDRPTTVMSSIPTIPGHANDEWSSILPAILAGEVAAAEQANIPETKPESSTVQAEKPLFSETKKPESSTEKRPEVLEASGSPGNQETSGDDAKKPEVEPSPAKEEEREKYTEKPMVPVPVITIDQKPTTQKTDTEDSPMYQILNIIPAENASKEQNDSIKTSSKPDNLPATASASIDLTTAPPKVQEEFSSKLPEIIPTSTEAHDMVQLQIITDDKPNEDNKDRYSTMSTDPSTFVTMSVISETHSTSMKVPGHPEIPLQQTHVAQGTKPEDKVNLLPETTPLPSTEDHWTIVTSSGTIDSEKATPEVEKVTEKITVDASVVTTESSASTMSGEFNETPIKTSDPPLPVEDNVKINLPEQASTTQSVTEKKDEHVDSENTKTSEAPLLEVSTLTPVKEKPEDDHSESSAIEQIIETLNQKIEDGTPATHEVFSDGMKFNTAQLVESQSTEGPSTLGTSSTSQPQPESKPMETFPTELANSLTSMINQVSDAVPSILPVAASGSPDEPMMKTSDYVKNQATTLKPTTLKAIDEPSPGKIAEMVQDIPMSGEMEEPANRVNLPFNADLSSSEDEKTQDVDDSEATIIFEPNPKETEEENIRLTIENFNLEPEKVQPETSTVKEVQGSDVLLNKNEVPSEAVSASSAQPIENAETVTTGEDLKSTSVKIDSTTVKSITVETSTAGKTDAATAEPATAEDQPSPDDNPSSTQATVASVTQKPELIRTEAPVEVSTDSPVKDEITPTAASKVQDGETQETVSTETKSEEAVKVEPVAESPLVKIKVTDSASLVNAMLQTATVPSSTPPVEPISLPENLDKVNVNNLASGLIAGFQSTTEESGAKIATSPSPVTKATDEEKLTKGTEGSETVEETKSEPSGEKVEEDTSSQVNDSLTGVAVMENLEENTSEFVKVEMVTEDVPEEEIVDSSKNEEILKNDTKENIDSSVVPSKVEDEEPKVPSSATTNVAPVDDKNEGENVKEDAKSEVNQATEDTTERIEVIPTNIVTDAPPVKSTSEETNKEKLEDVPVQNSETADGGEMKDQVVVETSAGTNAEDKVELKDESVNKEQLEENKEPVSSPNSTPVSDELETSPNVTKKDEVKAEEVTAKPETQTTVPLVNEISESTVPSENSSATTKKPELPVVRIDMSPEAVQEELPQKIQLTDLPIIQKIPLSNIMKSPSTTEASELLKESTTEKVSAEPEENNTPAAVDNKEDIVGSMTGESPIKMEAPLTRVELLDRPTTESHETEKKPEEITDSSSIKPPTTLIEIVQPPQLALTTAKDSQEESTTQVYVNKQVITEDHRQKVQEIRIQVNDTAVLVTKHPLPDTYLSESSTSEKSPSEKPELPDVSEKDDAKKDAVTEQAVTPAFVKIETETVKSVDDEVQTTEKLAPITVTSNDSNEEASTVSVHTKETDASTIKIEVLPVEEATTEQTDSTKNAAVIVSEDNKKEEQNSTDIQEVTKVNETSVEFLQDDKIDTDELKQNVTANDEGKLQVLNVTSAQPVVQDTTQKLELTTSLGTTLPPLLVTRQPPKVENIPTPQAMLQSVPEKVNTHVLGSHQKLPGTKKPGAETQTDHKWTLIPQQIPTNPQPPKRPASKPLKKPEALQSTTVRYPDEPQQTPVALDASQTVNGLDASVKDTSNDIVNFSKLCNELAFSFWMATNKGLSTARSLALSPFGMTSLLAMIFLGARGPTSDQMNELLRLDDVATFNPHLVFQNVTDAVSLARNQGIANAAFVRELFADKSKVRKLMPFYKDQAQQFYEALVTEVNFAAISDLVRRRTNLLIRKQTGGRIKDFVKTNTVPLRSPLAAMSANVFQTDCNSSVASSEGRDGELYFAVSPAVRQRKLVPVPATVWRAGVLAGYEPSLDATAVALGGIEKLVSTIFVIPGQQGHSAPGDTLDRLEQRLVRGAFPDGAWDKLLKILIPRPGLELQIPKFSHRSVVNATAALKRMGLDELFSKHADLKGINGIGNHLHLADVLQMNLFSTCGDENIQSGRHHVEIYPSSSLRNSRHYESEELGGVEEVEAKTAEESYEDLASTEGDYHETKAEEEVESVDRVKRDSSQERPRLKLDRPFLYFVRHNPTGLILHMGRFNPRLLP